jgi:hypothetical protein
MTSMGEGKTPAYSEHLAGLLGFGTGGRPSAFWLAPPGSFRHLVVFARGGGREGRALLVAPVRPRGFCLGETDSNYWGIPPRGIRWGLGPGRGARMGADATCSFHSRRQVGASGRTWPDGFFFPGPGWGI